MKKSANLRNPTKAASLLAAAMVAVVVEAKANETVMEPMVVVGYSAGRVDETISPSTVETIRADVFKDSGIVTAREALDLIPNVAVNQADSERASSFSVRGSHEITFHEFTGGRAGVGFYLDDVPSSDAFGRDLALFSVERFSFYKGPHGTAFGAPNSMGVIDVVTQAPDAKLRGDASYTYGSYELNQAVAHVSGPIQPNLFFGLDGLYARDEGWYEDRTTGDSYGKHEITSGRMRLRWLPTDQLEINFIAGMDHHDDDPVVYVPSDRTNDRYKVVSSPDAYADGGQNYQSLQALWKGDGWQVKSITSRRVSEFDDDDPVFLREIFDPGVLPRKREQDITTWTQEIRVESTDPDAPWRWRTGLFFGYRDSTLDHYMLGLGPWEGANELDYRQDDYALYGELTHPVGEQLELSAGLRLQILRDHTSSTFNPTPFAESIGGVPVKLDEHENFKGVLPMAAASWKWTDDQRSYFRFSTGQQPGGLALAAAGSTDYDTERSYHYELGHDSSFPDQAVQLHAALFYTAYRDYQSFQFNPAGQTIFNADRAHALGAEGEIRLGPFRGLELYLGAGYTKAKFDEFDTPVGDFSGNTINNIPVCTMNVGGEYRTSWGGMIRLDWRHTGDIWFNEANTVKQDGYTLLDLRIGYERDNYGAYLFARNLLNTEYYTNTYLFQGLPAATPGIPRIIGAELRASF